MFPTHSSGAGCVFMYTSLGDPPWLVVGAPMPTPGNTITANTTPTHTPMATDVSHRREITFIDHTSRVDTYPHERRNRIERIPGAARGSSWEKSRAVRPRRGPMPRGVLRLMVVALRTLPGVTSTSHSVTQQR